MSTNENGRHRLLLIGCAVGTGAMALMVAAPAGAVAPAPRAPAAKTIAFESTAYQTTEGDGNASVTLTRSTTKGKASVSFVTSDGTATVANGDYTAVSTTVTFGAKQTQATVTVPIRVDQVTGEPDQTVNLALSSARKGWTLGTNSATLTIHEMAVPSAPTTLSADLVTTGSSDAYVNLAWTESVTGPVDHYSVESSTVSGGPYTALRTSATAGYDVTPAPSVTTYYVVRAVNADNATSGYTNEAVAQGFIAGSGLYWASFHDGTIKAANPDGTGVGTLVSGQDSPFGVALDASHVYWANIGTNAIMRANLDGTGLTTLVFGQSHPYGVALDASHVYWTNLQGQTIMRANLDGSNVVTLVDGTGLLQPASIAVDANHIYWGDVAGDGSIMRADLDGANMTILVAHQTYPFAIAVQGSYLYWAACGDNSAATGTIMRSALDGTGVTTLLSGQAHPQGLAVSSTHIYWANANTGTIDSANLSGTGVTTLVSGQSEPAGVAIAS